MMELPWKDTLNKNCSCLGLSKGLKVSDLSKTPMSDLKKNKMLSGIDDFNVPLWDIPAVFETFVLHPPNSTRLPIIASPMGINAEYTL